MFCMQRVEMQHNGTVVILPQAWMLSLCASLMRQLSFPARLAFAWIPGQGAPTIWPQRLPTTRIRSLQPD